MADLGRITARPAFARCSNEEADLDDFPLRAFEGVSAGRSTRSATARSTGMPGFAPSPASLALTDSVGAGPVSPDRFCWCWTGPVTAENKFT